MSEYNLTRYLYARDEVELSFIAAILLRKGVDECYYWGYELHYSGFDVFPIIWKIYYDFYFVSNPGLETLIRHKEKMWERNKKLHYLAATISNLVNTPSSGEVFIMRQYIERVLISESGRGFAERGFIARGRPPAWCGDYDSKYIPLLRSIDKSRYREIAYHAYYLLHGAGAAGAGAALFVVLIKYFAVANKCKCVDREEECLASYQKFVARMGGKVRLYHWFMAIIVHLLKGGDTVVPPVYIYDKTILDSVRAGHEEAAIPLKGHDGAQAYNTLKRRRSYGVVRFMGGFALARDGLAEEGRLREEALGRWEHYIWNTPCWRERLLAYSANEKVEFENDDLLEDFYDAFGYEPDEQSAETQDQTIGEVDGDWFQTVFVETPCINFGENIRFIY